MKKLLLLIPALFLAGILFTSCQQEPTLVEPGNQEKVTITGTGTNCTPIMAGQNIVAGTVCLDDIDTNGDYIVDALQVVYTTTGDWELKEIHFAVGLNSSSIPRNRKGNLVPGQFPYKAENLQAGTTTYTITIPFSSLGYICGNLEYLYAAAHCVVGIPDGSGGYTQTETGWGQGQNPPGGNWAMFFTFKIECDVLEPPPPPKPHETAFAHGCENATCFSAIAGEDFSRWGWTNKLEAIGRYSFDLYAGAGQCNLNAGTLVGEVIVEYDGSTALVTFTTCGPYTMDETHLYVGNEVLPRDVNNLFTVAPGQYPYKHDDFETPVTTDSYTITGLSGTIYVVAHATVYSNTDFQNDCGTRGCEFEAPCVPVPGGNAAYYSDLSTVVVNGNVVNATYPHAAVYAHKPGFAPTDPNGWWSPYNQVWDQTHDPYFSSNAEWIWESYEVVNPVLGDVIELQREFNIPGTPAGGSLTIACDNGFAVYLNDVLLGSHNLFQYPALGDLKQPYVNTTDWQTRKTYTLANLQTGTNTLKVIAVNEYMAPDDVNQNGGAQPAAIYTSSGKTYNRNPGGVIFQFDVSWTGTTCP